MAAAKRPKMAVMHRLRTRLFQSWFRLSRSMTLGVRGLVIDEDGRALLVRHTYTPGWFLPGGGIEKGEPAIVSLERELLEEAGIVLTEPPELRGIFSNHSVFPNDHVIFFRATQWRQDEATSQGEIAEVRWVDPARPPEHTTPGTRRRLTEFVSGEAPGPYW